MFRSNVALTALLLISAFSSSIRNSLGDETLFSKQRVARPVGPWSLVTTPSGALWANGTFPLSGYRDGADFETTERELRNITAIIRSPTNDRYAVVRNDSICLITLKESSLCINSVVEINGAYGGCFNRDGTLLILMTLFEQLVTIPIDDNLRFESPHYFVSKRLAENNSIDDKTTSTIDSLEVDRLFRLVGVGFGRRNEQLVAVLAVEGSILSLQINDKGRSLKQIVLSKIPPIDELSLIAPVHLLNIKHSCVNSDGTNIVISGFVGGKSVYLVFDITSNPRLIGTIVGALSSNRLVISSFIDCNTFVFLADNQIRSAIIGKDKVQSSNAIEFTRHVDQIQKITALDTRHCLKTDLFPTPPI